MAEKLQPALIDQCMFGNWDLNEGYQGDVYDVDVSPGRYSATTVMFFP